MSAVIDFPIPKYRKGQKVYHAWHSTTGAQHPCPDCHGTKKWVCKSPAGNEMEMDCPRCDRNNYNDALSLSYTKHTFGVRELTIGSVRINTDSRYDESPISYMCEETGVGSGSVYYEPKLFETREQAEAVSAIECATQQAIRDATPEAIQRLEYSRKPYFRALEDGVKKDVREQVLCRLRNEIESETGSGEHSPGLWLIHEESYGSYPTYVIRASTADDTYGLRVCEVSGSDAYGHMVPATEAIHNARLISIAPQLLKLAETVIAASEEDDTLAAGMLAGCAAEMARDCIAKARGDA